MNTVIEIMTDKVLTLGIENSLYEARLMMSENRIRHIPIVSAEQELLGLISQRDVLAAEESSLLSINSEQRIEREKRIKIADFYKQDIVSIELKASLHKAARYMQKYRIGCLPVVDKKKLVGVITDSDFVNVAINLMEVLADMETS